MARDPVHRMVFSNSDGNAQTIYVFDYERQEYAPLFYMPSEMSYHAEGQRKGLFPDEMYLSPDGEVLVTLQQKTSSDPTDYLHLIDLLVPEVMSIPLHQRGDWKIPIVPGRRPEEQAVADGTFRYGDSVMVELLESVVWSPDSSGLVFTLGDQAIGSDKDPIGQIYYIGRGSQAVEPLASLTAGRNVGYSPRWSPAGRFISYIPWQYVFESLWVIDMQSPDIAEQQVEEVIVIGDYGWISDEPSILYAVDFSGLMRLDIHTGAVTILREFEWQSGEFYFYDLIGETADGAGYIAIEQREVNDVPDLDFQKLLYIDLETNEALELFQGELIANVFILPEGGLVWLTYPGRQEGAIAELPSGTILAGPAPDLYPPAVDTLGSRPGWDIYEARAAFLQPRMRSPDMQLAAGYQGNELVIWDVLTGETTDFLPSLPGSRVFLGWVPDPGVFDEAFSRRDLAPPPTPTIAASPTALSTPTPGLSATPRPTPRTPSPPSATPSKELVWAPDVRIVAEIDAEQTEWSPRAGELALSQCVWSDPLRDGIFLARAPAFEPRRISPNDASCALDDISTFQLLWRPDGARLAFSGLSLEPGDEYQVPEHISWMDRSGGSLRTFEAAGRGMTLVGWMDDHTLIYQSYGGGGTWDVGLQDTVNGRAVLFPYRVAGAYPPSDRLIPIDDFYGPPSGRRPARAFFRDGRDITFPLSQTFASSGLTRFEDWFPDGRTMLVLTWEAGKALEYDDPQTALEMWDTTTEAMTTLVPGGLYGRVSPDGRMLAFLAPHPLVVDSDARVQGVDRASPDAMLYLLEISTRRVIFSIEAAGLTETMLQQLGGERPSLLAWSPDSRRLVFYDVTQQVVLLEVETQLITPITVSGGQNLISAGWSFDGGYLSLNQPAGTSPETGEFIPGRVFVLVVP